MWLRLAAKAIPGSAGKGQEMNSFITPFATICPQNLVDKALNNTKETKEAAAFKAIAQLFQQPNSSVQ